MPVFTWMDGIVIMVISLVAAACVIRDMSHSRATAETEEQHDNPNR